jgi:NADH-quinone oxidoreductase subunit J
MDLLVFWLVAPVSVAAAGLMLFQKNAVHAALLLVLNQFTLAVFFVLLDAHFLAAVQVIVYAGAIMVLFLFVIMFLGVDRREALMETIGGQRLLAVGLGVLMAAELVLAVRLGIGAATAPDPAGVGSIEVLARRLFTQYVFPFEITSILLIVAAVAAMVLAGRSTRREQEGEGAEEAVPEREPVS